MSACDFLRRLTKKLISVASAVAIMVTACIAAPMCSSGSTEEMDLDAQIHEVMVLINETRVEKGLEPLYVVPMLNDLAAVRAEELLQNFSHIRPDGSGFNTLLDQYKVPFRAAAENIASGNYYAEDTFEQWKTSSEHWNNILSDRYTHVGIAVYYDENDMFHWYWSQIFINSEEPFEGQTLPRREELIPICCGDIDCDSTVTVFDLIMLLSALKKDIALNELQLESADCMRDGSLTIADAIVLKKYLFGTYKTLPIEP